MPSKRKLITDTIKKNDKKVRKTKVKFRNILTHPEGIKKNTPWPKITIPGHKLSSCIWIDEAGAGCYAGPLHIGATWIRPTISTLLNTITIHDSKLLKSHERNNTYNILTNDNEHIIGHVESISANQLDQLGGLGPTWKYGIKQAVMKLTEKVKFKYPNVTIDTVMLDGNKTVQEIMPEGIQVNTIIQGDQKFVGIACASILAKESRDRHMINLAEDYPDKQFYDIFKSGKGYRYKPFHDDLIRQGIYTPYHRTTYNPLKKFLQTKLKQK